MPHSPLVIGLVGEIGSGKGTCAEILASIAREKNISLVRMRFSDILRETLSLWHLPSTREHLQALPVIMNNAFGEGTLSRAVSGRINEAGTRIAVLDGVRWMSDAELIRTFSHNLIVSVTAPEEVRLERARARNESHGENTMTIESFRAFARARTEQDIHAIAKAADVTIVNDGSKEVLTLHVKRFWDAHIAPRITL